MPETNEHGKIVLFNKGCFGTLKGGSIAVWNKKGKCRTCCLEDCTPYVMATKTTNSTNPVWDLRPYQGPRQAHKGSTHWRIIERGYGLKYGNGTVDKDRELVKLPDFFRSTYSYNGYMQLQIGCEDEKGNIEWPSL